MTFTALSVDGVDRLLELMREFYDHEQLTVDEPTARAALLALILSPDNGAAWLIDDAGKPVGYFVLTYAFSLEFGGRCAWIDELYIRSEFRGRGVGASVLAFVEKSCVERGLTALRLEVARTNAPARQLYARHGFVAHDRDVMTRRINLPQDPVSASDPD